MLAEILLPQLAELDDGWNSAPNIASKIGGDDYSARNDVKRALDELHRAGVLERLFVYHADRPMACFRIDSQRLLALAEEAER